MFGSVVKTNPDPSMLHLRLIGGGELARCDDLMERHHRPRCTMPPPHQLDEPNRVRLMYPDFARTPLPFKSQSTKNCWVASSYNRTAIEFVNQEKSLIGPQENSSFRNLQTQPEPAPADSSETENLNDMDFRPIKFTGSAGEYWGIFITNLLLSIVTLGVYSAWAKVRRKRYFLNSTQIDGISLNYHATGMQLFKGRLIAFSVIVISSVLSNFFILEAGLIFAVLFLFVVPWVLNRSMRFNARVTSWRNVRFNWRGTYWRSFAVMWLSTPLAVISFGIMIPFISRWIYQYYVRRYSFGVTSFQENAAIAPFVKAILLVLAIVVLSGLIAIGVLTSILGQLHPGSFEFLMFGAGTVILIGAYIWYRTMCRNIVVRSLALGDAVKFHSSLKPYKVVWIQLTNFLASVLSLGLLIPWAQVRIYRYLCSNTSYAFVRSADEFIDEEQRKMSSFGEEFAELEGVDFSL